MLFALNNLKKASGPFIYIKLGVIVATIVLIVSSILIFVTFTMSVKEANLVKHSREVESALEKLFSTVQEGENSVRGYLLTNEHNFLQPYFSAKANLPDNFKVALNLTKDSPDQKKSLIRIDGLVKEKFISLDSVITLYEAGRLTPEKKLFYMNKGRILMDETRYLILKMQNVENDIYNQRYKNSKTYTKTAETIITIFSITSLIVIIVTFYILSKSQKEIADRELKYRRLFEQSPDIIFQLDKNLKIMEINPAVSTQLGYKPDELINSNLEILFKDENCGAVIQEMIKKGISISNMEIDLTNKDGGCYSFILRLYIDISARIYQGSLINITERKKMEREKIAMEKFAGIGKIARVIAHEVRNPLTNINLSVESLKGEADQSDRIDYISIIEKNSKRINNLITELLYTTKVNEINSIIIPINQLLDQTLELAIDRIQLKRIKLVKNYDPTNSLVSGDEQRLQIAFLNIIINAIEAMEGDNAVLKVETKNSKGTCLITISDNGKGIKKEDMENIFEPFFSTKKSGTGLGLATTQNIILLHSGIINVANAIEGGTKFMITLNTVEV